MNRIKVKEGYVIKDFIIVTGYYGSGKTSYCKSLYHSEDYFHICMDDIILSKRLDPMGSREKAIELIKENNNKNIVFDHYFKNTQEDIFLYNWIRDNFNVTVVKMETSLKDSFKNFIMEETIYTVGNIEETIKDIANFHFIHERSLRKRLRQGFSIEGTVKMGEDHKNDYIFPEYFIDGKTAGFNLINIAEDNNINYDKLIASVRPFVMSIKDRRMGVSLDRVLKLIKDGVI